MKRYSIIAVLTLIFTLASCKDPASSPDVKVINGIVAVTANNDSIVDVIKPLVIGNKWTYVFSINERDSGYNHFVDKPIRTYLDDIFSEEIVKDSIFQGNRWFKSNYSGSIWPYFMNSIINNKYQSNQSNGLRVSYSLDDNYSPYQGSYIKNNYMYDETDMIDNISTLRLFIDNHSSVQTIAGNFSNCYHFQDVYLDTNRRDKDQFEIYDSFFAKGIGLVLVELHHPDMDKFGGMHDQYFRYELSQYTVKKQSK